jgi:hypothetical protein
MVFGGRTEAQRQRLKPEFVSARMARLEAVPFPNPLFPEPVLSQNPFLAEPIPCRTIHDSSRSLVSLFNRLDYDVMFCSGNATTGELH